MSANTLFPETGPIMGFVGSMAGFLGGYAVGKALKAIARIHWGKLNGLTSQAANTTVLS